MRPPRTRAWREPGSAGQARHAGAFDQRPMGDPPGGGRRRKCDRVPPLCTLYTEGVGPQRPHKRAHSRLVIGIALLLSVGAAPPDPTARPLFFRAPVPSAERRESVPQTQRSSHATRNPRNADRPECAGRRANMARDRCYKSAPSPLRHARWNQRLPSPPLFIRRLRTRHRNRWRTPRRRVGSPCLGARARSRLR